MSLNNIWVRFIREAIGIVGGHEFLVAIAPNEYNRRSIVDVGRSLQKIVIHATKMGVATCWIGPVLNRD